MVVSVLVLIDRHVQSREPRRRSDGIGLQLIVCPSLTFLAKAWKVARKRGMISYILYTFAKPHQVLEER